MKRTQALGLLLAAIAALASCSGSVETSVWGTTTGAAPGDPADGAAGSTTTTTSVGRLGSLSPCVSICQDRVSPGCFPRSTCTDYCEMESPHWNPGELAAFTGCAKSNPLCYELIEDCMIGALYPEPIEQTVTVQAQGFAAEERGVSGIRRK